MQGQHSSILDHPDAEPDPTLAEELIKKCKAPLQSIMNFDYTFLMGFFRIDKGSLVVSSCFHKAFASAFLVSALMEIMFAINITSFYINDKDGSRIKRFTEMMLLVSVALNRIAYFYALWSNRQVLADIFKMLQGPYFLQVFFDPQRIDSMLILRGFSYVWSVVIGFSGMEVYRMDTLRTFGWSYADLLDIHEENILNSVGVLKWWAYKSGTYYNQAQLFNQTMQLSTFLLGNLGIVVSTAGYQLDSSIRDFFLGCTATIYIAIMALKMTMILKESWSEWLPEELRPRFQHIFQSYRRILRLAKNVNQVLRPFLPFMISSEVLNLVMIAFYILAGDWTYVVSYSFNLVKTMAAFGFIFKINDQVSMVEEWFISDTTQEVLDFPHNKYNATLFEFQRFPIGLGASATYICEGFLVTFINCALTYFFLVAQSLEGEEAAAAAANITCNSTLI